MLKIVTHPDPILRETSAPVKDIDGQIAQLAQDMVDTMHYGQGIGLAGVQVGRLYRIFVTHVTNDKPRVFINPQIVETTPEVTEYEEGCLSIPETYASVDRSAGVKVQAWNERGRSFNLDADGLLARVILHELDHLNGVLFIDYLKERKRKRLMRQYERVQSR